jgi:hypothetical protein
MRQKRLTLQAKQNEESSKELFLDNGKNRAFCFIEATAQLLQSSTKPTMQI